jgi:hypothetical protein
MRHSSVISFAPGQLLSTIPALQKRIIAERAASRSLRAIAETLTAEGVPIAQGGARRYASTVRHVTLEAETAA